MKNFRKSSFSRQLIGATEKRPMKSVEHFSEPNNNYRMILWKSRNGQPNNDWKNVFKKKINDL